MLRPFIAVCLLFFMYGCQSPERNLPYPLTVTEDGLGAIHADTPMDLIQSKLSGFSFEKLSQITPEHPEIIVQLKRGSNILAQIVSDRSGKKISAIVIVSPLITNRHNEGITGQLRSNIPLTCDENGCFYTDEPSVRYRLDPSDKTIREITYQKL
ncbi:MAG: hypothetical protein AB7U44_05275 [Sulfuricurvum sp.]